MSVDFGDMLFIDTSAFIALEDQSDNNYTKAQAFKKYIKEHRLRLVTTNYIFDEVYTWFRKNHEIAFRVCETILNNPLIILIRITIEDEMAAFSLAKKHTDKYFSFTDCTSFTVMDRLGITSAFTFDKHFKQYGEFIIFPK